MFLFMKGQQKYISQCLTLFINFVLPPVKRATPILAAPVINCLHYVDVLFAFLMLIKPWMTEILCPYIKGAAFIRQIGMFAAYFAPHHGAFIISLEPADILQPLFRKHTFFDRLRWWFSLVPFWRWWWNTKIVT